MELQSGNMRKVLKIKDDDSSANMNRTSIKNCTLEHGGWQDVPGGKGTFTKPEDLEFDPWDPYGPRQAHLCTHLKNS